MHLLKNLSRNELKVEYSKLMEDYKIFQCKKLNLNLSRGKPSSQQLDLSNSMLSNLNLGDIFTLCDGSDARNYGLLAGTYEARLFFANILNVAPENVVVGGNSSLKLMFDYINSAMNFGILGNKPWNKLEKVKFLCPCPGYDRHFAICEQFNIEMIPIEMNYCGPDISTIEKLVETDASVKGVWCVPKYSNPTGITYSDEIVRAFARLKPAAPDFRIFWDNAYIVHDFGNTPDDLLNIFDECRKVNSENMVVEFTSTSKITFPGGGICAVAASLDNVKNILKIMSSQTIGYNKINQIIHCNFFKSKESLTLHMKKHAQIVKPKFDLVLKILKEQLEPLRLGRWTSPNGGYFISFDSEPHCAKKIYDLCKQAGLVLTEIGATYPYKLDPKDSNIRIAPTFSELKELEEAMKLFCLCVKLATIEKFLSDK